MIEKIFINDLANNKDQPSSAKATGSARSKLLISNLPTCRDGAVITRKTP